MRRVPEQLRAFPWCTLYQQRKSTTTAQVRHAEGISRSSPPEFVIVNPQTTPNAASWHSVALGRLNPCTSRLGKSRAKILRKLAERSRFPAEQLFQVRDHGGKPAVHRNLIELEETVYHPLRHTHVRHSAHRLVAGNGNVLDGFCKGL